MDNETASDTCIRSLKDIFSRTNRLACGKLFHVRRCAHILNIVIQFGIQVIKSIIEKVRESVDYIRSSEARLKLLSR